jgi:hypothetical protein
MRGSYFARALSMPCRMLCCFLILARANASVGGKLNPVQPELIRAAVARMPSDAEIVARWMLTRLAVTMLKSCAARLNSPGVRI